MKKLSSHNILEIEEEQENIPIFNANINNEQNLLDILLD